MTLHNLIKSFAASESGALSVEYSVLSAAALGLALAATAILTGATDRVSSRMDAELRTRSLGDQYVDFYGFHFSPILETGYMTVEDAQTLFDQANTMMNYDLLTHLQTGITALEEGTITADEITELVAVASVVYQRNLADDAMLDYYFGFEGSDPYYMSAPGSGTNGAATTSQ